MESIDKYYRVYASVNLDNIYENMKALKDNTAPGTQMVAVVKTDGYGHGAVPVSKTIDELVREANEALKKSGEMTEEETLEDDAEGGYFQDEDD